jgi:alkanesulfonate monooxygenase SsuD/methylene tetrahydromethanopterin reductase-like flavin-dependent oxidoreductase (luciferase family)
MDRPFYLGMVALTYGASWQSALDTVRLADRLGYDAAFHMDHLFATGGDHAQPFFEAWTTLAGWSQVTSNVDLGLLVGANTFRNPGVVAKMAATLDHMSNGRAILGLGAAWEEDEQRAHGIDTGRSLGERLDWLDESLGLIRRVLAGEEVTSAPDDHYRFDRVRHAPVPVRRPLPVLVGGAGERKTLRIAARHADLWQVWASLDGAGEFARLGGVLDGHCEAVGRDPSAIRRMVGAKVILRGNRAEADAEFQRQLTVQPWSGDVLQYIADVGLWRTTPSAAVDAIGALIDAGAGGFVAQFYPPYDHETIERLATEVAPQLGWRPRGGTGP